MISNGLQNYIKKTAWTNPAAYRIKKKNTRHHDGYSLLLTLLILFLFVWNAAKLHYYFDMCKYFDKKISFYVVKHAFEGFATDCGTKKCVNNTFSARKEQANRNNES